MTHDHRLQGRHDQVRAVGQRQLRRRGRARADRSRSSARSTSMTARSAMSASSSPPADVTLPFVNGATGPIEVKGAKPGDMLTVEVLDMKVDGPGLQLALARHRHLPRLGPPQGVRDQDPGGRGQGRARALERQAQAAGPADDRRDRGGARCTVRCSPSTTAPMAAISTCRRSPPATRSCCASTIDGAHLFLGDCHAIQGDGECVGMGAVEVAAELEVRVSLSPAPARMNWPGSRRPRTTAPSAAPGRSRTRCGSRSRS